MIQDLIESDNEEKVSAVLKNIIYDIHRNGPVNAEDLEKLAYIKRFHPDMFGKVEYEILFLMGLFYKVRKPKNFIEEVYSIFSDSIKAKTGKNFTPVQADAYMQIKEKKFFSFSAPTSAGKSFLFKELISETLGDIVIVVPSRALVAEYLNTVKGLVDSSVLVLQFIENVNVLKSTRRVFVVTPERGMELFKYKNQFDIKLILLDEAQLSEEEIRGIEFDAFVRRASLEFPEAVEVFAHPFVENPEAQLEKHNFNKEISSSSLYKQNAVGKIYIAKDKDKLFYFSPYENGWDGRVAINEDIIGNILKANGTILIYTSKNKIYHKEYLMEYRNYLKFCPRLELQDALKYVEKLRNYIGAGKTGSRKESTMVRLMERGIVIHHGSMPLKVRQIIEEFVRANYAKICFSTSTLKQGINMPFDAVFIDNYRGMVEDTLTLKNLIGRAGRTTKKSEFNYGYTIINRANVSSFCSHINDVYKLSNDSMLDEEFSDVREDNKDLVEAIKTNSFDNDLMLTNTQIERLKNADLDFDIKFILDNLLIENHVLTGNDYYKKIPESDRTKIKTSFKKIFVAHLRRKELNTAEQQVISAAIPILLWHIQGKTFKEVLALRFSFLTQLSRRRQINALVKDKKITQGEAEEEISKLTIRYSPAPSPIPNVRLIKHSNFGKISVDSLNYDDLVFDTYDYIDKVINLSLANPICGALKIYFQHTNDQRALILVNYIKYGTNDSTEIWLLKYGFSFEDIVWIKDYVKSIDEKRIVFKDTISSLDKERYQVVKCFI